MLSHFRISTPWSPLFHFYLKGELSNKNENDFPSFMIAMTLSLYYLPTKITLLYTGIIGQTDGRMDGESLTLRIPFLPKWYGKNGTVRVNKVAEVS